MDSKEIRQRFLNFFENKGHKIVPSSTLLPENDPTTLFTGSGMQPMVPYLLGEKHPEGTRIANIQKCFRGVDIDEVGDSLHTTFFEMAGNWSFGDYFKEEQIEWIVDFLIDKEIGLGVDLNRFYVTTFIGDEKNNLPKDTESVELWKRMFTKYGIESKAVDIGSAENGSKVGMQGGRIFAYDAKENWWSRSGTPEKMPVGEPGGPDSEMFYDLGIEHDPSCGKHCHPACDCGRFVEIGNNVFMTYRKVADSTFEMLPSKNIDHGSGFERWVMVLQEKTIIYDTDLFEDLIKISREISDNEKSARIIADHIKASVFLITEGVNPSNTDRGYILRRLIRRAAFNANDHSLNKIQISSLVDSVVDKYSDTYPELKEKAKTTKTSIEEEVSGFIKTLAGGLKHFEKVSQKDISGSTANTLFTTYGLPIDLIQQLAKDKGIKVDVKSFEEEFEKHKRLSRTSTKGKFKGGLGGHSEKEIQYHTATHLLNAALREVLGKDVSQKGSNINPDRLRFDFTHSDKLTDDQKKKIEDLVNQKIKEGISINHQEMTVQEAEDQGAVGVFGDKYGETVKVYSIGEFSKEICGGPHVSSTSELGVFKIKKEEASSAGVRRIKAILE